MKGNLQGNISTVKCIIRVWNRGVTSSKTPPPRSPSLSLLVYLMETLPFLVSNFMIKISRRLSASSSSPLCLSILLLLAMKDISSGQLMSLFLTAEGEKQVSEIKTMSTHSHLHLQVTRSQIFHTYRLTFTQLWYRFTQSCDERLSLSRSIVMRSPYRRERVPYLQ